jgi:1A family penicillin-binding protein
MRLLLRIIFLFFILLIILEDFVIRCIIIVQNNLEKARKKLARMKKNWRMILMQKQEAIIYSSRRTYHSFFKRLRKKRKRTIVTFSLSWRVKVKYFFFGGLVSFLFVFLPLVIIIFLQDLPSPKELSFRQAPQTTKIYDRNGVLLAEFYATQNRTLISLSDIPTYLQEATLAIEDKNFYKHPGFDIPSIIRAFREDIKGRTLQGGSTITQQLIKSSILTPEQSISRKVKELVLAFWTEKMYSKNQILEMYFNQVPYGGTAWGAEAASETYFNKPVKELDLAESAFLAGLTSAPTTYSPYGNNPTLWKKRQKEVLDRMLALHYVSQKQMDEASREELHFRPQRIAIYAPHFVQYIRDLLVQKYGLAMVEKGGLQVRTSLDLKKQEMAEKIVKEEVDNDAYLNLSNGASVITDPKNGDILAMVGSRDFNDPKDGNVNIVTSLRQPGSSIKVVTYSAALSHGFTAATMLDDSPVTFTNPWGESYSPVNYDGKFHGRLPLRVALANSLNIPAIKTLNTVGIPTMVNLAKNMGVEHWNNPDDYGLSITLGAAEVTMLDMARVNGVLANSGKAVPINPILQITDVKGNVLEEKKVVPNQQVLDPGVAFIMSSILADNNARSLEFGPNSPLYLPGHFVSVKTGTTDDKRDNWTNGYTNDFVVIVWVGNNDNAPMSPVLASGITGAAPIWHKIMENLLATHPETRPTPPTEIVEKTCFGKLEYFIRGTENSVSCGNPIPPSSAYSAR